MYKLILRDIAEDDIILEKKFSDKEKASGLKEVLERYTDATRLEVKIIEGEKR